MTVTRRALLLGGLAATTGCVLRPGRAPRVHHPRGALGPVARPPRPAGAGLMVGAATIDLTPPPGAPVWLAGFGPGRAMREVQDPIGAQCLLLDDGLRRVALVMVDVIGLMRPSVQRIRALVGPSVEVIVASTHNHASPDTVGFWGPAVASLVPYTSGVDRAYLAVLERRVAQVVARAAASARPARLRVGEAPLSSQGLITNLRPPRHVEQQVLVVEAREEGTDAAIATLIHFACHVEAAGPRSTALGAGFPGHLRRAFDVASGGVTVFANGALGGMVVPEVDDYASREARRALDVGIAEAAAAAAREALRTARAMAPSAVRLVRHPVELPTTNTLFAWLETQGVVEPRPRGPGGGLITDVGHLELGPLALVLLPGEPTPAVGARAAAVLAARGFGVVRVLGLADDELGYLLEPATEYDHPEFGYEVSMSVGREAVPVLLAALARG
jgi:hypothetical protein